MQHGVGLLSDTESFQYQIIMKYITGKINRNEAAFLLKCSTRTISRLAKKIRERGLLGVKHGNYAKESNRKIDPKIKRKVLELKQKEYFDFNCLHFHEILVKKYNFKISYNTLWKWLKSTNYEYG